MILAGQEATEEVLTRIRHEHGLDQPVPVQFLVYLRNAVGGNLGISINSRQPVAMLFAQRFRLPLRSAFLQILVSPRLGVATGFALPHGRHLIISSPSSGSSSATTWA